MIKYSTGESLFEMPRESAEICVGISPGIYYTPIRRRIRSTERAVENIGMSGRWSHDLYGVIWGGVKSRGKKASLESRLDPH